MPTKPQVTVTLEPSGELSIGLPGVAGTTRSIPVKPGKIEAILQQVLFGLALGEAQIGQDGAPTQAQLRCWQSHSEWPNANCPFCRASGRFRYNQPGKASRDSTSRVLSERKLGDVTIRRIRPGMTAAQQDAAARRSRVQQKAAKQLGRRAPEELGL